MCTFHAAIVHVYYGTCACIHCTCVHRVHVYVHTFYMFTYSTCVGAYIVHMYLLVNIKGKSVPVYCQLHTFLTTCAQYTLSAHG